MTLTTAVLLLVAGIVPPAIVLILWRQRSFTIAEILHQVETSNRSADALGQIEPIGRAEGI